MKFGCIASELNKVLSFVAQNQKSVVRLDLYNNRLTATTRTNELSISCSLEVQGVTDGTVVLPHGPLQRIAHAQGVNQLTVATDDTFVKLKAGRFSSTLRTSTEYITPVLHRFEDQPVLTVDSTELNEALGRVLIAAALVSSSRPVLESVLFDVESEHLRLVACDGVSLAFIELSLPWPALLGTHALPVSFLSELRRRLPPKTPIIFQFNRGVRVRWPGAEIIGSEMVGAYPAYRMLVPAEFKYEASFDRDQLLKRLHAVNAVTLADQLTTLVASFGPSALSLRLSGVEEGETTDEVNYIQHGQLLPDPIGFIPKRLSEALRCTLDIMVTIKSNAANEVVEIVGTADYHHYIMPVVLGKRHLAKLAPEPIEVKRDREPEATDSER